MADEKPGTAAPLPSAKPAGESPSTSQDAEIDRLFDAHFLDSRITYDTELWNLAVGFKQAVKGLLAA